MPDPVDARLLAAVAEIGRAAIHDVAARLGMDPREVATRLVALSATGLPLVVGVECDPNGIRAALATASPWGGGYPVQGTPSGPYPAHGTPSGAYPVQGTPTGGYPMPRYQQPGYPRQQPHPGQQPTHFGQGTGGYPQPAQPSAPSPAQSQQQNAGGVDAMSTWGPPQSSSWARGDQGPPGAQGPVGNAPRTGRVGAHLDTEGLEGERLSIQLVEVVDPADFLFTAAGYRLQDGERAVVVHTELTNRGTVPFASLPDMYLVLVAADGQEIAKAPVSLSSRPPHRIGVQPGETAGGHTVYVLPESVPVVGIRWSPRPDDEKRSLVWTVEN